MPFLSRRYALVAPAAAALVLLAVLLLPYIGLQAIEKESARSRDLARLQDRVSEAADGMSATVLGPLRDMNPASRDPLQLRAVQASAEANEVALREVERLRSTALKNGLGAELDTYIASSYAFLDAANARAEAIAAGTPPAETANNAAYMQLRATNVNDLQNFRSGAFIAGDEIEADLHDANVLNRNLRTAAVTLAVFAIAAVVTLQVSSVRGARAAAIVARQDSDDRTAMLNLASHELRNPLSIASLNCQLLAELARDNGDPELESIASDAHVAVMRAGALVAEFLDLSRLDADRLNLKFAEVEVRPIIDEALALTSSFRGERPTEVVGDVGSARADRGRLQIILRNLVDNAWKYSPEKSKVAVVVHQRPGTVEIDVLDEGIGVPANDRERIFDRFQRLAQTEEVTGVGIGLHLSRELARRMGGDIFVAESDKGTRMRLVVPSSGGSS